MQGCAFACKGGLRAGGDAQGLAKQVLMQLHVAYNMRFARVGQFFDVTFVPKVVQMNAKRRLSTTQQSR